MEARKRRAIPRYAKVKTADTEKSPKANIRKGSKEARRELYRTDALVRESIRKSSRKYYRRNNPKRENKLKGGKLLSEATIKEVCRADGVLTTLKCYTIPASASAIGKSHITFKKWIANGWIPEPIYKDAVLGYKQYSIDEMRAVSSALAKHFEVYDYLNASHKDTISAIKCGVEKAR